MQFYEKIASFYYPLKTDILQCQHDKK